MLFIGPGVEHLTAVGDKLAARGHAVAAGLPVVPGRSVESPDEAVVAAEEFGFPILVKAVGGGGGRGMKLVRHASEMLQTAALAMAEAEAAFGDRRIYLERFVASGRHVEVQIVGDGERIIHLGDRDCSVQRRYQKVVEEAPAPGTSERLPGGRARGRRALRRAPEIPGSRNRGVPGGPRSGRLLFPGNECPHPGGASQSPRRSPAWIWSLSRSPLRKAAPAARAGRRHLSGHAFECRLNAENWREDFRPSPGTVTRAVFPVGPGIRVDTHMQKGATVPPFYDFAAGEADRSRRRPRHRARRLSGALAPLHVEGVDTNLGLHAALAVDPEFAAGGVDTAFLARFLGGGN